MSKGDSPRPHDPARYRSEWERIFLKKQLQGLVQRAQDRTNAMLYGEHGPHNYNAPVDGLDPLDEHTQLWEDEYHGNDPARGETGEET